VCVCVCVFERERDCEVTPFFSAGVNFTNVIHTAFTLLDPERVKKYS